MKKIRIVQIGIGHDHATAAIGSLRKLTDLFEVVGYVAPAVEVEKYGDRLAAFAGIPEMTLFWQTTQLKQSASKRKRFH